MRRRDFPELLGGAVAAWPLTARAQHSDRMRWVGMLMGHVESDSEVQARFQEFGDLGGIEGRNVRLDMRFAKAGMAPNLAAEPWH